MQQDNLADSVISCCVGQLEIAMSIQDCNLDMPLLTSMSTARCNANPTIPIIHFEIAAIANVVMPSAIDIILIIVSNITVVL